MPTSAAFAVSAAALVPQPGPVAPTGAKPFDASAAMDGLAGSYRFVAHLSGLAGMTELGGVVEGVVTDPTHFALDFPQSSFITHYVRDGSMALAVVEGRTLAAQPGVETAGAISPEDMLPGGIWLQVIAPWEETILPDGASGHYAASSAALATSAAQRGLRATDWHLSVRTDAMARLTTLAFSGVSSGQAFALDLVILYG